MENLNKQQILKYRKEIEQELTDRLKKNKSDFSLQDIKNIIFYEEDSDDLTEVVAMFDLGQDISELNDILQLINDAWNYFPHKTLDGLSPMEIILKRQENIIFFK